VEYDCSLSALPPIDLRQNHPVNFVDPDGHLMRRPGCWDPDEDGWWFSPSYSSPCDSSGDDFSGGGTIYSPAESPFSLCGGGAQGMARYALESSLIIAAVSKATAAVASSNCAKAIEYLLGAAKAGNIVDAKESISSLMARLVPIRVVHPCGKEDGPEPGHTGTYTAQHGSGIWIFQNNIGESTLYATLIHESFHLAAGSGGNGLVHGVLLPAIQDRKALEALGLKRPGGRYGFIGNSRMITDFIDANCNGN
jgi:hypothetical protein